VKKIEIISNAIVDIGIGSAVLCIIGLIVLAVEGIITILLHFRNEYSISQEYLTQKGIESAQQDISNIFLLMKHTGVVIIIFFVIFNISALYFHIKDEC